MSGIAAGGGRAAWRGRAGTAAGAAWEAPDARRVLQLALGSIWLLDAVLQYQPFMFTRAFGQMLATTAAGNPAVIAGPVTWNARLVEHHDVALNTVFATVDDRGRCLPAAGGGPDHPGPGHCGGRGHLGCRGGVRGHLHRQGHRPQLRPVAGPAGAGLLASQRRGHQAPGQEREW